ANINDCVTGGFYRQIVEFCRGQRAAVHLHVILVRADFGSPGRKNQILSADGGDDVRRRESLGLQGGSVKVHLHLALLSPVGPWYGGAFHVGQLDADEVRAQVKQPLLRKPLPGKSQLQNGHRGCAVLHNKRRSAAGRELPKLGLRHCRHLAHRHGNVGARLEENLDDGNAIQRFGLDVLNVIYRQGEGTLVDNRDSVRHLVSREARVAPQDGYNRDVDVGENVFGGADDRQVAQNHDDYSHHDEGVGPSQG